MSREQAIRLELMRREYDALLRKTTEELREELAKIEDAKLALRQEAARRAREILKQESTPKHNWWNPWA